MIPQITLQNILETDELCREESMRSYNKHKGNKHLVEHTYTAYAQISNTLQAQTHTHINTEMLVCIILWRFIISNGWSGPARLSADVSLLSSSSIALLGKV